jgi:general secretion pathway protein N
MRMKLPFGKIAYFLAAFLFALVALTPLRFGLDLLDLGRRGFAAREAQGSIWWGALIQAQFGSVELGNLQVKLRAVPLLLGQGRVDFRDRAKEVRGSAVVTSHSFGLSDVRMAPNVGSAFSPLPVVSLNLDRVTARFSDGRCVEARGSADARLAEVFAGIALPRSLFGTVRCDGDAVLLAVISRSQMEALRIRIFEDGRYKAQLDLRPSDETARSRLAAAGFVASPRGSYVLRQEGEF